MERTFDTPTPPRLELRVPAGRIAVEAVAGLAATELVLSGSSEALEATTVEQRGDVVSVVVDDRKGLFGLRTHEVDVRVRCPERAVLQARTKSADVAVDGLLASLDASTASGDVRAERVEGDVSLKSASGDLRVDDAGGEVSVGTASGDVEAGRVGGPFRANVVSGDLRLRDAAGPVAATTVSGDVRVDRVAEGTVELQSVSGDVEVGIRRGSRVHVDASSLSGDTRSELELGGESAAGEEGPLVRLRIKTVSGDIAVVRAAQEVPQP